MEVIQSILDEGFLAHVGFELEGQPFVIPTLYGREDQKLYLHGSSASRMLRKLDGGCPACISVTLVDGIVLARSAFNHSMNYRSVIAFGTARKIEGTDRKTKALRVISEHLLAGRWNDVRGPSANELKATSVLEFLMEEASAKIRQGPPIDDDEDYNLPVWAGVIPVRLEAKVPIADPRLIESLQVPEYVLQCQFPCPSRLNGRGTTSSADIIRHNTARILTMSGSGFVLSRWESTNRMWTSSRGEGALALWIGVGTEAFFANLHVAN